MLIQLVREILHLSGKSQGKVREFQTPMAVATMIRVSVCEHIKFEGFGGKRALGFLLKSELCQKRSKFRMQFCLHVSNNALHVFPLKFASFLKY